MTRTSGYTKSCMVYIAYFIITRPVGYGYALAKQGHTTVTSEFYTFYVYHPDNSSFHLVEGAVVWVIHIMLS